MLVRVEDTLAVGVFVVASCVAGCSTTLSTLQPAEPMRPGHVQADAALDVVVPASRIVGAVAVAGGLGARFVSDPHYEPTTEDARRALAAAIGLGLSAPGVNLDVMLRVGIVRDLDVGLRWSGLAAHADAKYRFLATRPPSVEEERRAAMRPGDGPDPGFQGAISVGVSRAFYGGFVFDALDFLDVADYSRWNLEVPVIFGGRLGEFGHAWFGPKYVLSRYALDASLKNVGIVPESSGIIHHVGAFGGFAVGYRYAFVFVELSAAWMFADPEILGRKTDLGGLVVAPSGGLMLRL